MSEEFESDRQITIIAVDDDAAIRKCLPRVFAFFGFSSSVVESGADAITLMGEHTFDIALVDFRMPNMNGVELCRWISEHHPNTAIVMMTGYASDAELEEALDIGVFQCIRKPLPDLEKFGALIKAAALSKQPTQLVCRQNILDCIPSAELGHSKPQS
ncbi:MAG: response regulator [Myxococcales bacterium]|nr:response regulator [Myxococcales bacterium]HIK84457.1 response regulator [Myxococcales bacterium]